MVKHGSTVTNRRRCNPVLWMALLVAMVAASAALIPGCITDPQARAEIGRLMRESKAAQETVKDAFGKLDTLLAKLKPLKEKIASAWRKLKAKEIPGAEAAQIIGTLTEQKESLLAEIAGIKEDIIKGNAQFKSTLASAKTLRDQFNISPWAIGGTILLSLLGGATGTGMIARVGSKKLRGALQVAQQGLKIFTGAVESAEPHPDEFNGMTEDEKKIVKKHQERQRAAIKKQIAGTKNAEIEAAVAEARTAVAVDTVSRAA